MRKLIIAASVILWLAQCKTSTKLSSETSMVPTDKELSVAQKTNPSITLVDLKAGRTIYFNQCTECHKTFDIPKFSEKKWKHEIDDMSPKAKLTDEQKKMLSDYILSYREANAVVAK